MKESTVEATPPPPVLPPKVVTPPPPAVVEAPAPLLQAEAPPSKKQGTHIISKQALYYLSLLYTQNKTMELFQE